MRLARFLLFVVVASCLLSSANAQTQRGIPTDGRDFYLAYVAPSIKCGATQPFQAAMAIISSYYDCNVSLNYFDPQQGGKEIQGTTYHIAAKNAQLAPLDLTYMDPKDANGNRIAPDGEVPLYAACHIHADRPVSVAYYSTGPNSGGMYLAFQTGALGKTYVVAAAPANPANGAARSRHFQCTIDSGSSEFAIIAIKDNTKVTITPTTNTKNLHHVGVNTGDASVGPTPDGLPHPFTVPLSRGQVYWVKSDMTSEEYDMSGSIVEADQPVGVIGACESMYNGYTQYSGFAYPGDQRDLSVEMMVPVDYWTTEGYVSMPFMDSPGGPDNDVSAGDLYKVYTYDPAGTQITFNIDQVGPRIRDLSLYQNPPVDFPNVQTGVNVSSNNGKKIMVEEYDYRAMFSEPFPAPSQMNIIPLDRFRTSYVWGVPDDKAQVHKKRYINVIANRLQFSKIKIQHNGAALLPLTSLTSAGQTASIPGHPELQGRRFEIQPGGYYATGDSAFALYQYGDLGLDPDYDLGDNDDDDYYFSYASTCGQSFGIDGAYSPSLRVDTICNGWHVHVSDGNPLDRGIAQVEILKDPLGVQKRKPNSDSGYMSTNASFDPPNFTIVPGDTLADFFIQVDNPLQDADAWVYVLNRAGNDTLIYLHYKAPHLSFLPDTAAFFNAQIGIDTCVNFTFKNLGKPTELAFNVTGYHWKQSGNHTGQGVRLVSSTPAMPHKLVPGDSIVFHVCFNASTPAVVYHDTLIIETDCPTPSAPIVGSTTVPRIETEDYDFGTVNIGQKKCHPIRVWNSGQAPFALTKQWVLDNVTNFEFADFALLPDTLKPGETISLNFCYIPMQDTARDSTTQHWTTDMTNEFKHIRKDFSNLLGRGIKPDLTWDRATQLIQTECDSVKTFRAYLRNYGTAQVHVDSVLIAGSDLKEWKIIDNSNHKKPLNDFVLKGDKDGGPDSIWVDVTFTPDLSKALPWKDRVSDTLWAYGDGGKLTPYILLYAIVTHPEVNLSTQSVDLGTSSPGVASGTKTVTVTDSGTAPLIIESISVDPPFSIVQPGSLKQWDTIQPGKSKVIILQGLMNTAGTDTGTFHIKGMTNCAAGGGFVTMSTSFVQVAALGHDYVPTYICKNNVDNVAITSSGSRDLKVLSVQIVDAAGSPGESSQFQFADGSRLKTMSTTLIRNQPHTESVLYIPTLKKSVQALVIFTVDTVDGTDANNSGAWTITKLITGTGLLEHQTVSLANPATGPYIAQTAQSFSVPVQITETITPKANVQQISLDMSYTQDLFQLADANNPVVATAGYQVISAKLADNAGIETISMVIAPNNNGAFTNSTTIANVNLELMVARDTSSDFAISNVHLYSNGGDVCYVLHDTVPGTFTPLPLCSDSILRRFLRSNTVTFSIGPIHPNPATSSARVDLTIHRNDVPMTMELFNVLGQNVRTFSHSLLMPSGARTLDLDLSGMPAGTYSLRVTTPEQVSTKMLLIQK